MAVTAEARAQATAGEERPARREAEVVGSTGLTTSDQDGTPANERRATRRDCQAPPLKAGVVRRWHGKDKGPGGTTVWLI